MAEFAWGCFYQWFILLVAPCSISRYLKCGHLIHCQILLLPILPMSDSYVANWVCTSTSCHLVDLLDFIDVRGDKSNLVLHTLGHYLFFFHNLLLGIWPKHIWFHMRYKTESLITLSIFNRAVRWRFFLYNAVWMSFYTLGESWSKFLIPMHNGQSQ